MSVEVFSWAMKHSEAKLGNRLVLFVIADHAKDDGTSAWPSVATIAMKARLSERQAQRCLRALQETGEIMLTGKSRKGTNIYSLPRYIAAQQEGDNLSGGVTDETLQGDISGIEGVTPMSPDPSLEPSMNHPKTARAQGNVIALRDPPAKPAWKVDRKPVTISEDSFARLALVVWNEETGQSLNAKEWLSKIVMRYREHPELTLHDHQYVIRSVLSDPWWDGVPSPSLVYGNSGLFEQAIEQAKTTRRVSKPARFGRGLSTAQIGKMFGGDS